MSWVRKQIDKLVRESNRRQRWVRGGVLAAVAVALVVTAALVRGATAASQGDVSSETVSTQGQAGEAGSGSANATGGGGGEDVALAKPQALGDEDAESVDGEGSDGLAGASDTAVDGKNYLTDAVFTVAGTSGGVSEVDPGTSVTFHLTFTIPPNTLSDTSEASRTVVYNLPDGFVIPEGQTSSGDINGTGNLSGKIGTYSIANGKLTMVFDSTNRASLFTESITTAVVFVATAQNSSTTTIREINFDGKGTLTVRPTDAQIAVSKSVTKTTDGNGNDLADGTDNKDRHATYRITVNTTTGTGRAVTITDSMAKGTNVAATSYDTGSFKLTKHVSADDATGTTVDLTNKQPTITTEDGAQSFSLSGLEALVAGEWYELTYSATVTESNHTANTSETNSVAAKIDDTDKQSTGSAKADWTNQGDLSITKTAQLMDYTNASNEKERKIRYQLVITTQNGSVTRFSVGDTAQASTNIDTSSWRGKETSSFFDHSSFKLLKYTGTYTKGQTIDGTQGTDVSSKLTDTSLTWGNDSGKPSFGLSIEEPLNAGEYYVLTYEATVYESDHNAPNTQMNNSAVARLYPGGTMTQTDTANAPVSWRNEIQKAGSFNKSTGYVDWTVWVNRNSGGATSLTFDDTLPQELVTDVVVTQRDSVVKTFTLGQLSASGGQEGSTYNTSSKKLHVAFGSWANVRGEYVIKFSTKAPQSGNVSNTATIGLGGKTYTSQGVQVNVVRDTAWTVTKSTGEGSGSLSGGLYTMSWTATATMPDADRTPNGNDGVLKLTDTFANPTAAGGSSVSDYTGLHYAVAKDLYAELTGASQSGTTVKLTLHNDADSSGGVREYTLSNGTFTAGSGDDAVTLSYVHVNVTLYDAGGNVIENPSTSDTKAYKFDLVLTCDSGSTLNGRELKVSNYHTVVDASRLPANTQLQVSNSMVSEQGNVSGSTSQTIQTMSNPMEKQVRTLVARADNDDSQFAQKGKFEADWSSTASGDYGMSDGQHAAQFRIALNTTTYPDNATVTITDTLPVGMKLVTATRNAGAESDTPHPIRLVQGNNVGQESASYKTMWASNKSTYGNVLTYTTSTNDAGQQVVTFTFQLSDSLPKGQYYITYTASFLDDTIWDNLGTTEHSYVNTASANVDGVTYEDSATLNVTRTATKVQKSKNGELTNDRKGKYKVVINPAAEDLKAGSDTIVLVDNLTGWSADTMNPVLDLNSVHLYVYDPNATNDLGAELGTDRYSLKYNHEGSTRQMTVTVPDEMALVLVYDYTFNRVDETHDWGTPISGTADLGATVNNTAKLEGYMSEQLSEQVMRASSEATAFTRSLTLYKVDAGNYANTLGGSKFSIYKADANSSTWSEVQTDVDGGTVDASGTYTPHSFGLDATTGLYEHDVLYKFVETTAPTGYGKTVVYVVLLDQDETADQAWKKITGSEDANAASKAPKLDADGKQIGTNETVSRSDVTFVPYHGDSLYVEDEFESVRVTKEWAASDGTPLSSNSSELPDSIKLQLKQSSDNGSTWSDYGDVVTVSKPSSENGTWTYTWNNLRQSDAQSNKYIYKVEEVDASSSWKATYLNNEGISNGGITITNVRQYSLPQTGGVPLTQVLMTGTLLAAGSAIILTVRRLAR